jgi:hypothetical protein
MMRVIVVALVLAACGGPPKVPQVAVPVVVSRPKTVLDRMVALVPPGAQVIVELDLARLRANGVVGGVATRLLGQLQAQSFDVLHGLPEAITATGSPLAGADAVVLAAFGVGTAQAATITLLATKAEVPSGRRISPELVAIGPPAWLDQLVARETIDETTPLTVGAELQKLRDHAVPDGAPGATLRITAQLAFDARIALARQLGVEMAPAQLSVWGDIADDVAIVVDADATDPGDKKNRNAPARMQASLRRAFATLGDDPAIRALGVTSSLDNARFVVGGTWARAVVTMGPAHLKRVVERAKALVPPT